MTFRIWYRKYKLLIVLHSVTLYDKATNLFVYLCFMIYRLKLIKEAESSKLLSDF